MASWFSWFHDLLFQLLDTSGSPLAKAASWREGCHPPPQTLQDPLIDFIKHRDDQKAACRNPDRGVSTLATQPTETEKGRPAPYKFKTSAWNSTPKSSTRSLGLFLAATIAQALPARCESQSPLRTAPIGSWLWRYKVSGLKGLGGFFLKTRCPKNVISSPLLGNTVAGVIWVPTSLRCWSEEHPGRAFSLPSTQKPKCECKWTQDRAFKV